MTGLVLTPKMVQMLKDRWREQLRLVESAGELMLRTLDWPKKQDEPFSAVTDDMKIWLKEMAHHVDNLATDLEELDK